MNHCGSDENYAAGFQTVCCRCLGIVYRIDTLPWGTLRLCGACYNRMPVAIEPRLWQ